MIRSETLVLLVLCPWSSQTRKRPEIGNAHRRKRDREREREGGWLAVARFETLVLLVLCPWSSLPPHVVSHASPTLI